MMKSRLAVVLATAVVLGSLLTLVGTEPTAAGQKSKVLLKNVQHGNPGFKSIGRMSFGPDGILLVADPRGAAVVAIDTGDKGPVVKLKKKVENVKDLVAASLGAKPGGATITDMVVNPKSGKIYLSVKRADNLSAILTIDADGKIGKLDLDNARYVRVTLPGGEKSIVKNITGVAFAEDRVLAAGQCNEEFASKIYSLPLPLTHGSSADIYSAETYHVAHRRWETRAPIQSFIPYKEDGKNYIIGSFACTPIAKFPLDDLKSGAKVTGASVIELGSGNRPLDMFTYTKNGRKWLVTNTYRFHFKKNVFGPSKWWGVRVDMGILASENINKEAARRNTKTKTGPEGVEIMDVLFGVVEVSKLNDNEIVVLRDREDNGVLDLELAELP